MKYVSKCSTCVPCIPLDPEVPFEPAWPVDPYNKADNLTCEQFCPYCML